MVTLTGIYLTFQLHGQNLADSKIAQMDTIKIESHIKGLQVAMVHLNPKTIVGNYPVLFIHGASFPSAMAFAFKMSGMSWMDYMSENNFETYALDFLGYGNADRYPEMQDNAHSNAVVGSAAEACQDIDKAAEWILQKTGRQQVIIIAHSWGASVAALYASQHPRKVSKLVLFAPITLRNEGVDTEKVTGPCETMTPLDRVKAMKSLTPEGEVCRLEPELFSQWQQAWLASDPLAVMGRVRYPAGPELDVENLQHNRPYYDPAKISCPTLIIRGEWDRYPSNEDAGRLFVELKNASAKKYVVIEKATHVMHLEKSRWQLYQEVAGFLAGATIIAPGTISPNNRHPIAVIFEVIPAEGKKAEYLDLAAALKPELEKIDGFISIERFQSIYHPEKILSLSVWRDERAIEQWRNLEIHRSAQAKGRSYIFKDYRLRVADVVRDYGMFDREEAPADSKEYHEARSRCAAFFLPPLPITPRAAASAPVPSGPVPNR
jgi:pimeloyl-ACP methyl ester carboxylesterase/heme-degrading monooxygenase HmoA